MLLCVTLYVHILCYLLITPSSMVPSITQYTPPPMSIVTPYEIIYSMISILDYIVTGIRSKNLAYGHYSRLTTQTSNRKALSHWSWFSNIVPSLNTPALYPLLKHWLKM